MNNYRIIHASGTSTGNIPLTYAGRVVGLGLGALILAANLTQNNVATTKEDGIKVEKSPQTFGRYIYPVSGEPEVAIIKFEEQLAEFYNELLGKQESLGGDFEAVLYKNLSRLLIKS